MYLNNYLAFFAAIRARHPHMRLVANCDMGQDAPTGGWGCSLWPVCMRFCVRGYVRASTS